MPVGAEPSPSSTTIGDHIRFRRPRNQTSRCIRPISPVTADDPPLTHVVPPVAQPTRLCKSSMSSFFLVPTSSSSSNETSFPTRKKPVGFPQTASFRGLGCAAAASHQVSVPAVIRSSAEWGDTKKLKDKKKKSKKKINGSFNGGSIKILSDTRGGGVDGSGCVAIPDVWCGPGIGYSTDAVVGGSVDPVVPGPSRRNITSRRKIDGDRYNGSGNNNHRENYCVSHRRSHNQEFPAFWDSDSTFVTSRADPTMFSNRHHRHFRPPYPDGIAEIMMLQNGFVMGGVLDSHDHFRDLRLDVDNMSYEQLLELGERIGYVNTGLKEEEINRCLCKIKPSTSNSASIADKKCSICQDEYEKDDETGKLNCGHSFHVECVKQWLSRKNACPVCKTAAYMRS